MIDNLEQYNEFLTTTIKETYPKYAQRKILKELERDRIVHLKSNQNATLFDDQNIVNLVDVPDDEKLPRAIQENQKAIGYIEKTEFRKSYKYAVVFSVSNFEEDEINQLLENKLMQDFDDEGHGFDKLFDPDKDIEVIPTKTDIDDNVVILKFSKLFTGYLPSNGAKKQIKYPILAIYYKTLDVLEIRFDPIKGYFKQDEYFYHKQIQFVLEWFNENLSCELDDINLPPIIEYICNLDEEDVNVHSQAMSLKSGGRAVLDTGVNENYVLPLLGELKELIKANEELFNENHEIKNLIENFILETEETSDLPWISLVWKDSNSKGTVVKFNHNYMNQGYTLLQYYGLQTEMERMNNVTEYIIKHKGDLESEGKTQ
ncbi:hypothetical protein KK120_07705 [Virgibacillus dakarensis]|nr:hypothetical protein [Virgibacillus dakarensis]